MEDRKKSVIDDGEVATARLETLVDGVFGIAMTLLVLDIRVPQLSSPSALVLLKQLNSIWPNVLSFIVSFIILGMFWVAHHTEFRYIKKLDNKLIWQNLFYLLLVALFPFSAALLGRYPHNQTAVIIYALHLICMVVIQYFVWLHVSSKKTLLVEDLDIGIDRLVKRITILAVVGYLVAIGLSFFWVDLALVIYALVPMPYIFGWIYRLV